MEPDVVGVLSQFKSIKKQAIQVRQSIRDSFNGKTFDAGLVLHLSEGESLVEEFKDAKAHFDILRYKQQFEVFLRNVQTSNVKTASLGILREIEVECDKAIGVLGSIATPLSKEDLDKLTALRKELEKLSEVLPDINYERNLSVAIDEYEKGDYFASALISSRVIISALDQMPGKSDEEKVNFLHEKGIIEKGRKDIYQSIIKAGKLARNVFSHDIKVFPTLSEAHSLLGEAFRILEIVSNILKYEKKEF